MRAGLGLGIAALLAALATNVAGAQSTTAPAGETPPASDDVVGPRELRDFSLPGTTRRPPEPAPEPTTQPPAPPPQTTPAPRTPAAEAQRPTPRVAAPQPSASAPARTVTTSLPPVDEPAADPIADAPQVVAPLESQPSEVPLQLPPAATIPVDQNSGSMLPWLLAALALAIAAAGFALRQRSRAALASGGALESFVPAEPAAADAPSGQALARAPVRPRPSAPPATAPAAPAGIVSTRLRPWIDLSFVPTRCVVEEAKVTIEFDLKVTNSGGAVARDVLVEAQVFNAGPTQDQEIGGFFERPVGKGRAIPMLSPLKSFDIRSSVSLTFDQLRVFEVAGRRVFVPLIGFNALYRSGSNRAQTSRSYLVGREGEGDKMAPFRLDLGPRLFRGLGAREHHLHVRN